MKRIEQWATEPCPDLPYVAPELHGHVHVSGIIDGKEKLTSRVVKAEGRIITTKSGTVYELGEPRAGFVEWCAGHGTPLDSEHPIKLEQVQETPE